MNRKKQYSLLLLAGGKSFRMGKNKAQLIYKGKTFVDTLLEKAEILGIERIYLSGYQTEQEHVQVVWDVYSGRGPLGGIHAGMNAMSTPYCLVLPVDVPQIPVEVLENMLRFHEKQGERPLVLQHGQWKEYLIGIYPIKMKSFIENRIKDHPASVHGVLEDWGYECYEAEVDEWQVANINTLDEYEKLINEETK